MKKGEAKSKAREIRVRTQRLALLDPKSIEPAPDNFRTHGTAQRRALREGLDKLGFVGAVIVRSLGRGKYALVDGHMRVEDWPPGEQIPALVTDLSEAEALEALATYDALGSMAEIDVEKFKALAAKLPDFDEMSERLEKVEFFRKVGPPKPPPPPVRAAVVRHTCPKCRHRFRCDAEE